MLDRFDPNLHMKQQLPLISRAGPELELVFRCARTQTSATNEHAIAALVASGIDWAKFLEAVEAHRVLPLVSQVLQRIGDCGVPEVVLETLRVRAKIGSWRNGVYIDEIVRLDSVFAGHGMAVIHYKGPVTAAHLYGDTNLRSFADMDFLVRRADLFRLLDILQQEGYRLSDDHDHSGEAVHLRELKEYALRKGPITLEPHWSITARRYPFEVDYESFWRKATKVALGDNELLAFSLDDLMLVLAVVGSKSRWERVQKICDIAECARAGRDLDWVAVHESAVRVGCERMLLIGLHLAGELLDAPLDEVIRARIERDRSVRRISAHILETYTASSRLRALFPAAPNVFSPMLFSMRERPREKLLYLVRSLTTPTALHMRHMPLPPVLHPLYRVLTPLHDYVAHPVWKAVSRSGRS